MALIFAALNVGWRLLHRWIVPAYVFVVYPGTERDKRLYVPAWAERFLRPLSPSGIIHYRGRWGLMVSGLATAELLERRPEAIEALLSEARREFPLVEVIALAGRLPSIAARAGVDLGQPFTRGDRGTLSAMLAAARELARRTGRPSEELTIAVPGGGGFVGMRLALELGPEFGRVVAVDPRYRGERRRHGNIVFTDSARELTGADVVIVLTRRGEEMGEIAPFLSPGTLVADDTHPEMPPEVRRAVERRGAELLKASVYDERFHITPRIPMFRCDDIPGCLLEALVVLDRGRSVLRSQLDFDRAAQEIGFRVRLAPHIDRP
jgi:predicted amino acid dehydrogenase